MGDGGGGHCLVQMEWRPDGWSVCLPLLISSCTIKSGNSFLEPPHPGCPGKRAKNGCGVCDGGVRYWCGYLSAASCKWFAYGQADATATPFCCRLTQVVLEKRPLNGCSSSSSSLLKFAVMRLAHNWSLVIVPVIFYDWDPFICSTSSSWCSY